MSRGEKCAVIPLLLVLLLFQAVISVHTELVAVPVTVTDARGHHVSGLGQENFRVFEDGRPQPIAVFHHGDAAVTLGLIIDRSQSMRSKTPALVAAVSALLRSSRPDDELFMVDFNDRVSFARPGGRPFTHDAKELATSLTAVDAGGKTALYDGIAEGLQHLQLGHGEKHALIVVSDGGDNASRRTYADVLALARRSDAVIYAIGLLGTPPAEEEEDAGLIKRLCKDTGGAAYFPRSTEDIVAASAHIARDLREQYALGFAPGAHTGGRAFRKIEVRVSAPGQGRLHVRTRSGYVVDGDKDERDNKDQKEEHDTP
jgi:Ca-activated chloride channel family protein